MPEASCLTVPRRFDVFCHVFFFRVSDRLFVPPVKVAAESTVEAAAGEEVLAVRRAFVSRVSRWSRDSPPASGPGSGLRARRLDPPSLEVCDIKPCARSGMPVTSSRVPAQGGPPGLPWLRAGEQLTQVASRHPVHMSRVPAHGGPLGLPWLRAGGEHATDISHTHSHPFGMVRPILGVARTPHPFGP